MTVEFQLVPQETFERIRSADAGDFDKAALIADLCRANALMTIKRAGSGHIGSSFSALDIMVWLYFFELNTAALGFDHPDRDLFFSSKGHDAPGLYAALYALGVLPESMLINLRRLEGTCGHPDVRIPGIESNSGSLGMGISKGKGMALAKRIQNRGGRVVVMTGDGEWQEGQIYESLQTAAHQRVGNLIAVVDHNKVQSDMPVEEIVSLGDFDRKAELFGWRVIRCLGHDFSQIQRAFETMRADDGRPKLIVADTIKGKGVSFMEHPAALQENGGLYRWHAGAPDDEAYVNAHREIIERAGLAYHRMGLGELLLKPVGAPPAVSSNGATEVIAEAYGAALVELGETLPTLTVLDADLASDCKVRGFGERFPERFIENGIAEQDMVSAAGGLARQGLLPVVNSFSSFLAARPNEQIYANACENDRIIYVCHYAGLFPAGPGHTHQSVRDISLFGALPDITILQPCNGVEAKAILRYCVEEASGACMIRINIGPSPSFDLTEHYQLRFGQGVSITRGGDAALFAYGPHMLNEALQTADRLSQRGVLIEVINMPWLNRFDRDWLKTALRNHKAIFVLEDHSPTGGLGDRLLAEMNRAGLVYNRPFHVFGVEGVPAWGTMPEALRHHGLDRESLVAKIENALADA
ncbi:MAG: 1-deoxy-D-xylulose-5-phosphate synthase [bacterium]|nr:1-deoxy-D-xylulose-5-phosphate synthase [bacterium]